MRIARIQNKHIFGHDMEHDIRWIQRLANYTKALKELQEAVCLSKERSLSKLEKQGLIQCFEYTHELAWKTLKDFLEIRGTINLFGSKDATREAFKLGLISQGDIWMNMIKSRNQTSHLYDEKTAEEIALAVIDSYFPELVILHTKLQELKQKEPGFS